MGCKMGYLDVGGGLAIDYDGSQDRFPRLARTTRSHEYAADVVAHVQDACSKAQRAGARPSSARAAAPSRRTIRCWCSRSWARNEVRFGEPVEPKPERPPAAQGALRNLQGHRSQERAGVLARRAARPRKRRRACSSTATSACASAPRRSACSGTAARRSQHTRARCKFVPEELYDLERTMSAIYYCNFSIFQSAPDIWAIDQLFPDHADPPAGRGAHGARARSRISPATATA